MTRKLDSPRNRDNPRPAAYEQNISFIALRLDEPRRIRYTITEHDEVGEEIDEFPPVTILEADWSQPLKVAIRNLARQLDDEGVAAGVLLPGVHTDDV